MMSQHVSSRTLPSFKELYASADALREPVGVAVAGGDDPTVLAAAAEGIRRGWIRPLLCGDASRVRALAAEQGIELSGCTIIDAEQPAVAAVECIHRGEARLLMKGQIATPDLMKAVLNRETGLRTERVICQMVLMEIPRDQRVFLLTDTGITIAPTLEQKTDLIRHLVETARLLGCPEPRLAVMSATEKVNAALPDTLDAEFLTNEGRQGRWGACQVSGPLSFDLAYHRGAGDKKRLEDPVIGHADGMLFPDLVSANLTVKAIMYTADCHFGGVLRGTSAPVVFMSRADDTATRLNSLAYTLNLLRAEQYGDSSSTAG